jgi:hypothetical protein
VIAFIVNSNFLKLQFLWAKVVQIVQKQEFPILLFHALWHSNSNKLTYVDIISLQRLVVVEIFKVAQQQGLGIQVIRVSPDRKFFWSRVNVAVDCNGLWNVLHGDSSHSYLLGQSHQNHGVGPLEGKALSGVHIRLQ